MTSVGGNTNKQTYVTTYTTDVDPRTLPDYTDADYDYVPSAAYERRQHTPSGGSASSEGHRQRKKYTTTTVTTVTTTTILLPKMQEAVVFPTTTTQQVGYHDDDNDKGGSDDALPYHSQPPRLHERAPTAEPRGPDMAPAKPVLQSDGTYAQPWVFNQQNQSTVTTDGNDRLPTLGDLGISSYFSEDGAQPPRSAQNARPAPYVKSYSGHPHYSPQQKGGAQPWVSAETRDEIEGGNNYYRR